MLHNVVYMPECIISIGILCDIILNDEICGCVRQTNEDICVIQFQFIVVKYLYLQASHNAVNFTQQRASNIFFEYVEEIFSRFHRTLFRRKYARILYSSYISKKCVTLRLHLRAGYINCCYSFACYSGKPAKL